MLNISDSEIYSMGISKILKYRYDIDLDQRTNSYILFNDNLTRNIIHKIKYASDKHLATFMGYAYARYLNKIKPPHIHQVDVIIPIPLSSKKFKKRGYNQSEVIAIELRKTFTKAVIIKDILIKNKDTQGQATKNFEDRITNIAGVFHVKNSVRKLENKHILLVDDVFTSGATIACVIKTILKQVSNIKISIAVLAYRPFLSS
ncbi:MAG: ComF family protein [Solitalea-like symbiont of Tyrophagus putrescentiae]